MGERASKVWTELDTDLGPGSHLGFESSTVPSWGLGWANKQYSLDDGTQMEKWPCPEPKPSTSGSILCIQVLAQG